MTDIAELVIKLTGPHPEWHACEAIAMLRAQAKEIADLHEMLAAESHAIDTLRNAIVRRDLDVARLEGEVRVAKEAATSFEARCVKLTVEIDYQATRYLSLAKHTTERVGTPKDWACAQCRPYSELLVDGFVCEWHKASNALAKLGGG
jgi:hypothetical protein